MTNQEEIDLLEAHQAKLVTAGYPPSLAKATVDEFDYLCRLRTGEVIRFCRAKDHGAFVTLWRYNSADGPISGMPHEFPRGVDVRLVDIVWCADAPDGS